MIFRKLRRDIVTFQMTLDDRTVVIKADVNPGYDAKVCFDHDHPSFSDPGDPGGIEFVSVKWKDTKAELTDDEFKQLDIPEVEDRAFNALVEENDSQIDAYWDRRYEEMRDRQL